MEVKTYYLDMKAAPVIVSEELTKLKEKIIGNIRTTGQNASGRTIASLVVKPNDENGATLWGHRPFGVLETGRRGEAAGASGSNGGYEWHGVAKVPTDFEEIIYKWMQDKGVHGSPIPYKSDRPHKYGSDQERGDRTMAYYIARKIRRLGSKLYREGGRADVYSSEIPQTVEAISQRIQFLMSSGVEKMIYINSQPTTIGG